MSEGESTSEKKNAQNNSPFSYSLCPCLYCPYIYVVICPISFPSQTQLERHIKIWYLDNIINHSFPVKRSTPYIIWPQNFSWFWMPNMNAYIMVQNNQWSMGLLFLLPLKKWYKFPLRSIFSVSGSGNSFSTGDV